MHEVLFCFCILLHWRVFLPLVESSCQIWFPMLTFAFLSLPLLRKTDVKIRKQTEKRETKRKQETVFYVFLRVSLANIGKFKLSLKALILSAFTFICFLVFSNAFRRTKIFLTFNRQVWNVEEMAFAKTSPQKRIPSQRRTCWNIAPMAQMLLIRCILGVESFRSMIFMGVFLLAV